MTTDVELAPRRQYVRYSDEEKGQAKAAMAACVAGGSCRSISALHEHHGVGRRTIQMWLEKDHVFRAQVLGTFDDRGFEPKAKIAQNPVPDFETFRREAFGNETYAHQREWLEVIEANDLSLILVPPEHAKTTTLSIEYPTWRIAKDRDVRIVVVSKSQTMARKILGAVSRRLTDHDWYSRMGRTSVPREWGPFSPGQGQKREQSWTKDLFYVSGIDSGEKDPTMEALGVGGQIYGARADLIILDDVATLKNMASPVEREKILEWLAQEVLTRLSDNGKLLIVGTRVNEQDIYSTLLNVDVEWAQDFTPLVRPAIIDEPTKTVLWPEYWPLEKLVKQRRNRMPTRTWNLVYQQSGAGAGDNPFSQDGVDRCLDRTFSIGQVANENLPIHMGVDPALSGMLALTVVGFDRATQERWLIDCISKVGVRHPEIVKSMIVETAARYGVRRCRIEKNAMQGFLSRDAELRRRLLDIGCQLEENQTDQNKYDPDWGVASIAAQMDQGLWHLPWMPASQAKVRGLVEEMLSWRPGSKGNQDRLMSMWFAELSGRVGSSSLRPGQPRHHRKVPSWARKNTVPRWVGSPERPRVSTFETEA